MSDLAEHLRKREEEWAELCKIRERPLRVRIEHLEAARARIGKWLSAALEDPNVCQEMKDDIKEFMR